jgi:radical SAM-linked protein
MDSWYDNLSKAFAAWEDAIREADLDWKYRLVENGEWNLFAAQEESRGVEGAGEAGEAGEQGELLIFSHSELSTQNSALRTQNSALRTQNSALSTPLPWDHIDTGIDKKWLIEDLQRALEAAVVPDCSFEGCSHCGVCGTDFGHNIVIEPPTIPEFAGDFVPNITKTQRLRVWFGKQGDMALLSHLDVMRLFDRVVRRASLPVAYTNGFHPSPKIAVASALALGATSSGEIVDFELTESVEVDIFHQKLAQELPPDIPIYRVEQVDLKAPAANKLLEQVEYLITIAASSEVTPAQWQTWIEAINIRDEILWEQTTKSGKTQIINLRSRLFELELISANNNETESTAVLRYVGSCRQDGLLLRPEQVLSMLEIVAGEVADTENLGILKTDCTKFHLWQIHRNQLILAV